MSHRGEGVWYPEANLTVAEGDDDQIGGPDVKSSFYIFKYSFFISRIDGKFLFLSQVVWGTHILNQI